MEVGIAELILLGLLLLVVFGLGVLVVLLLAARRKEPQQPAAPLRAPSEAVREAMREGRKIDAIKLYRDEEPAASLAAAKAAVERLEL